MTVARFVRPVSWPPSVPLPGSVQSGPRFAAVPGRRSHRSSQARNSANVCGQALAALTQPLSAELGPGAVHDRGRAVGAGDAADLTGEGAGLIELRCQLVAIE